MPGELNLTVPKREPPAHRPPRLTFVFLLAILAVGVANLLLAPRGGVRQDGAPPSSTLKPDAQKELALRLERQGLHAAAVRAWQAYLREATMDDKQRANLWYRIGKIQQDADRHEEALEAFYTSETIAPSDELAPEIARRSRECLEALGKFAALRQSLAERVELRKGKETPGEEILAEIGPEKITRARLDQMLEEQIDIELSLAARFAPPEELKGQKEFVAKRFATAEVRRQFLEKLVNQELLYRKAREEKLAEEPRTRALLAMLERSVLAERALDKELAAQVKITPSDLQTYHEAHAKDYRDPEEAQISHILVKDEAAARTVLKRLKGGEKFEALARELSLDTKTKEGGGEVPDWIRKGAPFPDGLGPKEPPYEALPREKGDKAPDRPTKGLPFPEFVLSDEGVAVIFTTEAGQVADKLVKSDQGLHVVKVRSRKPERQRPFEEVRRDVYSILRERKTREASEQLLAELRERYNVVIHHSKLAPKEPESEGKGRPAPTPKGARPKGTAKQDDAK